MRKKAFFLLFMILMMSSLSLNSADSNFFQIVQMAVSGGGPPPPTPSSQVFKHEIIKPIGNELNIIGPAPYLTIKKARYGRNPKSVSSEGISWSYKANDGIRKKVIGRLDSAMPAYTSLELYLAAPAGGGVTSCKIALTPVDQDLITSVPPLAATEESAMIYRFNAKAKAGSLPAFQRVVTLTLINQ